MLADAGLEPIGVFFASADADSKAREAYRAADGGRAFERDPTQADLLQWHELEEKRGPQLFGRMHCVYARKL